MVRKDGGVCGGLGREGERVCTEHVCGFVLRWVCIWLWCECMWVPSLFALALFVGPDQELHADAAEGRGVLPHPLHHAQGEATL